MYIVWIESYLPLVTVVSLKFLHFDVRGAALVEYLDQHPPPWRKEQFGVPTLYNVAELHIRCLHNSWWFLIFLGDDIDFVGFQVLQWMRSGESILWCFHSWCRTRTRCSCHFFSFAIMGTVTCSQKQGFVPVWCQCWVPKLRSSSDVCWSGLHRWDAIPRRKAVIGQITSSFWGVIHMVAW